MSGQERLLRDAVERFRAAEAHADSDTLDRAADLAAAADELLGPRRRASILPITATVAPGDRRMPVAKVRAGAEGITDQRVEIQVYEEPEDPGRVVVEIDTYCGQPGQDHPLQVYVDNSLAWDDGPVT